MATITPVERIEHFHNLAFHGHGLLHNCCRDKLHEETVIEHYSRFQQLAHVEPWGPFRDEFSGDSPIQVFGGDFTSCHRAVFTVVEQMFAILIATGIDKKIPSNEAGFLTATGWLGFVTDRTFDLCIDKLAEGLATLNSSKRGEWNRFRRAIVDAWWQHHDPSYRLTPESLNVCESHFTFEYERAFQRSLMKEVWEGRHTADVVEPATSAPSPPPSASEVDSSTLVLTSLPTIAFGADTPVHSAMIATRLREMLVDATAQGRVEALPRAMHNKGEALTDAAIRERLRRFREAPANFSKVIEVENPRPREPRYLWKWADVAQLFGL